MLSQSFTTTESTTFTVTHARHIAARIATDLARLTAFYPTGLTESRINRFQDEAIEYLKAGYLKSVTYGFRIEKTNRDGSTYKEWVIALKYIVKDGNLAGGSSSPGGIKPSINVDGTNFSSFLVQNNKFFNLDQASQDTFKQTLSINRTGGTEPEGNWRKDRAYGQGGRYVDRFLCGN